jgi:hypothetical protein
MLTDTVVKTLIKITRGNLQNADVNDTHLAILKNEGFVFESEYYYQLKNVHTTREGKQFLGAN